MVIRICRSALLTVLVLSTQLAIPAAAQPENHLGEALASIMVSAGCTMTQSEAGAAMQSQGWHVSDFQAQALALSRDGYLTSNDGGETLRLNKWGVCR
jgi:hypothetical protein